jgi:hypothetical protein
MALGRSGLLGRSSPDIHPLESTVLQDFGLPNPLIALTALLALIFGKNIP